MGAFFLVSDYFPWVRKDGPQIMLEVTHQVDGGYICVDEDGDEWQVWDEDCRTSSDGLGLVTTQAYPYVP